MSAITIDDCAAWGACKEDAELLAWYPGGRATPMEIATDERIDEIDRRWILLRALAERDRGALSAWCDESVDLARSAAAAARAAAASYAAAAARAAAYAAADAAAAARAASAASAAAAAARAAASYAAAAATAAAAAAAGATAAAVYAANASYAAAAATAAAATAASDAAAAARAASSASYDDTVWRTTYDRVIRERLVDAAARLEAM